MYVNSAYWKGKRMDFKDRSHPLFVGSCGTYRILTRPVLPTHRPRGRLDFQLLYILRPARRSFSSRAGRKR